MRKSPRAGSAADELDRLEEALRGTPTPPGDPISSAERAAALAEVAHLRRRLGEGLDAPLRVVLVGPTGCGKSKLLSSLAGVPASPSGVRRPFTEKPLLYVHLDREEAARRTLPPAVPFGLYAHEDPSWREAILIDTPDCDSVVDAHRRTSSEVERIGDLVILVADVHKYGDALVWDALRRLEARGGVWAIVLNKVVGPGPSDDLRARLSAEGIDAPLFEIAERRLAEGDLIPASDEGLAALAAFAADAIAPERRRVHLSSGIRRIAAGLRRSTCEIIIPRLTKARAAIDLARADATAVFAVARVDLPRRLEVSIDPAARRDLYRGLLARIERIDPFRYPRRLLSLPWRGAAEILRRAGLWPRGRGAGPAPELAEMSRRNREIVEEVLTHAAAQALERLRELGALIPIADAEKDAAAAGGRAAARYDALAEGFRDWVREQAIETAARLTVGHRVQFYLAQALLGGILLGVEIHTGGTLSVGEVVAGGIATPLIAKLAGIAISSDEARRFATRAREKHGELCEAIVDEEAKRIDDLLGNRAGALQVPGALARTAESLVEAVAEDLP
ncbi:MAG: hypothetical protein JXP34_19765 [Planctomycetes bacterium]|nr:hypothetical protein [Planctomycetota bacterium]